MATDRDPYPDAWDIHPTIDDEQAEDEARYWAHRWALDGPPGAEPEPESEGDVCRDCGAPLDEDDEPFTYCERCLPAAIARDPWPWPLPEEMP